MDCTGMPRELHGYQLCHETTGREIPGRVERSTFHIQIAVAATFDVGKECVTMTTWPCFHRLIAKHEGQGGTLLALCLPAGLRSCAPRTAKHYTIAWYWIYWLYLPVLYGPVVILHWSGRLSCCSVLISLDHEVLKRRRRKSIVSNWKNARWKLAGTHRGCAWVSFFAIPVISKAEKHQKLIFPDRSKLESVLFHGNV